MKRAVPFSASSIAALGFLLAGCVGVGVDQVVEGECPPVAPLATADRLPANGFEARITAAQLSCYVDRGSGDLLAEVTLTGATDKSGVELPFFVAALDDKGVIISRTQMKVTPSATQFSYALPKISYGRKGSDSLKARLVVGFVLSDAQLAANRRAYSRAIGLSRDVSR